MVLIVECESCRSRFRVKKSLLGGTFAIRFRCRTCDGFIVVRNPDMRKIGEVPSPVPSPSPVSPEVSGAPATDPEPDRPAIGIAPTGTSVRIEGAVPLKPAKPDPPVPEVLRVDDLVPFSPGDAVSPGRKITRNTAPGERVATGPRSTIFKRRASVIGAISFIAGLGILLLVGAASYFGPSNHWGEVPAKKSSLTGSSSAALADSKPAYDVRSEDSYILPKTSAGKLFVITGTVKNVGNAWSRGIRIHATLFGKDNQVLMEQTSIAGNMIDKFSLTHTMRIAIEGSLSGHYPEGRGNRDVSPGDSLPFMVVCFEPPGEVESYEVLATNADL